MKTRRIMENLKRTAACLRDILCCWLAGRRRRPDTGFEHMIRIDGERMCVFKVENAGARLLVGGWDPGHRDYRRGDRIVLVAYDGTGARYTIEDYDPKISPSGQYFMTLKFNPRWKPEGVEGRPGHRENCAGCVSSHLGEDCPFLRYCIHLDYIYYLLESDIGEETK